MPWMGFKPTTPFRALDRAPLLSVFLVTKGVMKLYCGPLFTIIIVPSKVDLSKQHFVDHIIEFL
jgi:hypothetical protein